MKHVKKIVDWVFLFAVPIVSLGMAYKTIKDSRDIADELAVTSKELLAGVDAVSKNLTTRYLDESPRFTGEVVRILRSAKSSLRIATDLPAYGAYRAHGQYLEYVSVILAKASTPGMKVQIVTPQEDERKNLLNANLNRSKSDGRSIKQLRNSDADFQAFEKWSGKAQTFEDVYAGLEKENNALWNDRLRMTERYEYRNRIPLLLWIADDDVAIFSFPHPQEDQIAESAWVTHDPRLIEELQVIFAAYTAQSEKPSSP